MVKFYQRQDCLKFSWDQVAQAFWTRYPNPFSSHVLTEDVIFRKLEDSKLYSKRLLTKTNRLPKWGEKLVHIKDVRIIEESVVDAKTKTITTYTRNIGFRSVMALEEKCVYRMSHDNAKATVIDRQAWISSSLKGFATAIQAFGVERFKSNCNKTLKGYIYILEQRFPTITQEAIAILDTDKFKETAKKAKELAKSKAVPLMAACSANRQ